jgi:hypothetical protein
MCCRSHSRARSTFLSLPYVTRPISLQPSLVYLSPSPPLGSPFNCPVLSCRTGHGHVHFCVWRISSSPEVPAARSRHRARDTTPLASLLTDLQLASLNFYRIITCKHCKFFTHGQHLQYSCIQFRVYVNETERQRAVPICMSLDSGGCCLCECTARLLFVRRQKLMLFFRPRTRYYFHARKHQQHSSREKEGDLEWLP